MIFDEKQNLDFYRNLGIEGRYAKAVDFLKNTDLAALEPGKYEIDGKDVYANVTAYTTIPWEEAKYEAHEHYTDIQYVIEGSEVMTYAPVHEMTVKTPYNPDKDVVFFENTTDEISLRKISSEQDHEKWTVQAIFFIMTESEEGFVIYS